MDGESETGVCMPLAVPLLWKESIMGDEPYVGVKVLWGDSRFVGVP